jgi:hypothetical protein
LLAGALGFDRRGVRHRAKINRHLARFILIALYTGTRHDAILRLQWIPNTAGGWIDLASGVIYRRAMECALDSGQFQAAFLTGCWACRSSYCAGLR